VETKWTRLKRTQTRSWYNSRLVKAKTSKVGFKIKAFHCLFRRGETGCRHLNDWTAGQETLWSAEEKARKRKKDGGNLDGRKTKKENSAILRQGNIWKQWGCEETPLRHHHTIARKAVT
jgi:hypothetical protein